MPRIFTNASGISSSNALQRLSGIHTDNGIFADRLDGLEGDQILTRKGLNAINRNIARDHRLLVSSPVFIYPDNGSVSEKILVGHKTVSSGGYIDYTEYVDSHIEVEIYTDQGLINHHGTYKVKSYSTLYPDLADNTIYYVRARSVISGLKGAWSKVVQFITPNNIQTIVKQPACNIDGGHDHVSRIFNARISNIGVVKGSPITYNLSVDLYFDNDRYINIYSDSIAQNTKDIVLDIDYRIMRRLQPGKKYSIVASVLFDGKSNTSAPFSFSITKNAGDVWTLDRLHRLPSHVNGTRLTNSIGLVHGGRYTNGVVTGNYQTIDANGNSTNISNSGVEVYYAAITATDNNNVYVIGGRDSAGNATNKILHIRLDNNTHSVIGTLPSSRIYSGASKLSDGTLLVTGGSSTATDSGITNTVYSINTQTGNVTPKTNLPMALMRHAQITASNGTVYIFGGQISGSSVNNRVYASNDNGNSWYMAGRMSVWAGHSVQAIELPNGLIYVFFKGVEYMENGTAVLFDPSNGNTYQVATVKSNVSDPIMLMDDNNNIVFYSTAYEYYMNCPFIYKLSL